MTDFPDLKMKALVNFPPRVTGGPGIDIDKTNGAYSVNLDYSEFAPALGYIPDSVHQTVLLWNSLTNVYALAPMPGLTGLGNTIAYNIMDFGAIPNDSSKGTVNAAAILTAFNAKKSVWIPDGFTFYIETLHVPVDATGMYGNGKLVASGTQSGALIVVANNTGKMKIDGIRVEIDPGAYSTIDGIYIQNSQNVLVQNCTVAAGGNGIKAITSCEGLRVYNNTVTGYGINGIQALTGNVTISKNTVGGGRVASIHAIQAGAGSHLVVTDNHCDAMTAFGVSIADYGGVYPGSFVVEGNVLTNCTIEGINVNNGSNGLIHGNVVSSDGRSVDFGISLYGTEATAPLGFVQDCEISGNVIVNVGRAGIALAERTFRNLVSCNYIFSSCQFVATTDESRCGIILYGGNGANFSNTITGNTIIDNGSRLKWLVAESNSVGSATAPLQNFFGQNFGSIPTVALYKAASTTIVSWDDGRAWTAYTPTVTGTASFVGTATGRFKQIGKTVFVSVQVTCTTGGNAGSVSLPVSSATSFAGVMLGREVTATGALWQAYVGGSVSVATLFTYNNTIAMSAGHTLHISGTYENA